jgi:hypothetical protein
MPDFTRYSWVSELARSVWEPRIARVMSAWLQIEWLSVVEGIRECGLVWVSPGVLPSLIQKWEAAQLSAIGIDIDGSLVTATAGAMNCVAIGALDKIEELRRAWSASDSEVVGRLLGYPECCRAFFRDVWVEQRCIDTTWAMGENTPARRTGGVIRIEVPNEIAPLANILWRWVGVRAVPHLPCRFDCSSSIAFGKRLLELGRAAGCAEEAEWIAEILTWPVEWSALHGIAEVKSPLMKISTRTDATAGKSVIKWAGTRYPKEGAIGLRFPFRMPEKPVPTLSRGFPPKLDHDVENDASPAWRYADNGFASEVAMETLHEPIVSAARKALNDQGGNVLDLGCGNGVLLAKVCQGRSDLIPYGIDSNEVAVTHARKTLPQFAGNFVQGDLFDIELWDSGKRRYKLALLMLGRLFEVPGERAAEVVKSLRSSCSRIVVYAYPDWSGRRLALAAMARRLGLELQESDYGTVAYL